MLSSVLNGAPAHGSSSSFLVEVRAGAAGPKARPLSLLVGRLAE